MVSNKFSDEEGCPVARRASHIPKSDLTEGLSLFGQKVAQRQGFIGQLEAVQPQLAGLAKEYNGSQLPAYLYGVMDSQNYESYDPVGAKDGFDMTIAEANAVKANSQRNFVATEKMPDNLRSALRCLSEKFGERANTLDDDEIDAYARGVQDGERYKVDGLEELLKNMEADIAGYRDAVRPIGFGVD